MKMFLLASMFIFTFGIVLLIYSNIKVIIGSSSLEGACIDNNFANKFSFNFVSFPGFATCVEKSGEEKFV